MRSMHWRVVTSVFQVDEDQELLRADFEIGQMIRDQIVPRAVLFYTGEATDEDDLFDDYDGEDEDEVGFTSCF